MLSHQFQLKWMNFNLSNGQTKTAKLDHVNDGHSVPSIEHTRKHIHLYICHSNQNQLCKWLDRTMHTKRLACHNNKINIHSKTSHTKSDRKKKSKNK